MCVLYSTQSLLLQHSEDLRAPLCEKNVRQVVKPAFDLKDQMCSFGNIIPHLSTSVKRAAGRAETAASARLAEKK